MRAAQTANECIFRKADVMEKVIIREIAVEPPELNIFEIKEVEDTPTFFAVYPAYYNVRLIFSPLVIQRMLEWLVKNQYVEVKGQLIIKVRNLRSYYNESSKKENDAP